MKPIHLLTLAVFLCLSTLSACQSATTPITIQVDGQVLSLTSSDRLPQSLLVKQGVTLGPDDRILYLGSRVDPDVALPEAASYALVVRRAVSLTVNEAGGTKSIQTSALSVGQALSEAGYSLYRADRLDPPAETPIHGALTVTYQASRALEISVDSVLVQARSAADSVNEALAEAGIPLTGLDTSQPDGSAPLPADGHIRVVRVVETVSLTQDAIPFDTRTELSADLEIDHQALLVGGEPGLSIGRVRTRSADGVQVAQTTENQSIVRPAQDRVLGIGTKIVIRTATVDGVDIEYWRTLRLFATSYSPCRIASPTKTCGYGSASGIPAGKGVVAFAYYWYLLFGFEHLYIPGYGPAVVGDVGGGYYGSHYWVDLGYSDADYIPWAEWVTVYFLTPVPANPGYILP